MPVHAAGEKTLSLASCSRTLQQSVAPSAHRLVKHCPLPVTRQNQQFKSTPEKGANQHLVCSSSANHPKVKKKPTSLKNVAEGGTFPLSIKECVWGELRAATLLFVCARCFLSFLLQDERGKKRIASLRLNHPI